MINFIIKIKILTILLLENEILKLRAVEPDDLEMLYIWENDPQLWLVGNTRQPLSKFALKQYIIDTHKDIYESRQLRLMIVEKKINQTVGTVDLYDYDIFNSRIALGLFVDKNYQGHGLATQALRLVEDYVFNYLQLHQLYCHISTQNIASRSMFEKEGYENSTILQKWIKTSTGYEDIIIFQRFAKKNKTD